MIEVRYSNNALTQIVADTLSYQVINKVTTSALVNGTRKVTIAETVANADLTLTEKQQSIPLSLAYVRQ